MQTAEAVAAPEAVFAMFRDRGADQVHKMGVKYSKDANSPYTSTEDFEQEVWTRMWEWLDDPSHVEQAIALLEDDSETRRFLTQFARARICDLIDVALAGPRDQRLTITASMSMGDGEGHGEGRRNSCTLLEFLAHGDGTEQDNHVDDAEAMDDIRAAIGPDSDAQLILDTILAPPEQIRDSFCESRLRLCRGLVTLEEADTPLGTSRLSLTTLEGYDVGDAEVTWTGPLGGKRPFTTSQGAAVINYPEAGNAVIRWTETKLVVRLSVASHEGEFLREVIRPSPKVFDYQVMRDYLGISGLRIRDAWLRLHPILRSKLGAA